jgi:nitrite reductase/ring-hydroxylating ferredoxin subunit
MEQAASLDVFLAQLSGDRRPALQQLTPQETAVRMAAAQLRLICEGIEEPAPEFLQALDREVGQALAQEQRRLGVSRGRFLRRITQIAAATGLVGVGAAADELGRHLQQPEELVAGPGRWYDVAGADELSSGQVKHFSAGGVLGFLVDDSGHLHAVSAICTHMGCRLKPAQSHPGFRCPCHGAKFGLDGRVLDGLAREALPRIDVRVVGGRVYARGTVEDV